MTNPLDMSLDDLIKSNRKSGLTRTRPPLNSGNGPSRRFPNRAANRTAPYSKPVQAPDTTWQHDMFVDDGAGFPSAAGRASSIETGTKLYISNLDYGVSNEDIKELFSEVGDMKRYSVHYDRSGRSKGTAEVVFSRRTDAAVAFKRYNGVQLDGKPMKIEIVGTNVATPVALPPATNGKFANPNGVPRSGQGRGSFSGRSRGPGRGARRGRGQGRGQGEKVSAEDLDADLENYHKEAMQTE
ncbi:RNA-binding family protein [Theobroma cacao]|uniref:RNA-binding family protein n=1 Tax=Theobroma cacao TaxID=3641 RepID=A0A061ET42_THECC|nr:RNA-binding family protein [Theobroma cacao]